MQKTKIVPVILCGGTGKRLWPLSRASYPKQYLEIDSKEALSFLQCTVNRIKDLKNINDPIVICNEDHRFIVSEQMRNIKTKTNSILLEPVGRNTAPAVIAACLKAIKSFSDPLILVLPADHIIKNKDIFFNVIKEAIIHAEKGEIVTFGITPNKAEIGFGYIESEQKLDIKKLNAERIVRFIEKPDQATATKLILDKRFSWNSGIFLFKASSFLNEVLSYCPDIYQLCEKSLLNIQFDLEFQRLDKETFSLCENISIDKAIMEKTKKGVVLPLDAGWNDIGNWEAMWEVSNKNDSGNVEIGKVVTRQVKNSYIRGQEKLIVGIGLEDLIIVESNDALLVVNKKCSQDVKNIVEYLETHGEPSATIHKTIFRPWGEYTSLAEGPNWQVKKIMVKPGESLSLQLHNKRTEHWIIVSGIALVEIDGNEKILQKNESTFIPLKSKHRLSNSGKDPLILIEVQSGDYLGEDDIVRFADKYGRII
tara:strand:- start:1201 stop:2640 length:1440 start_codon:yes stop_codon:yes gene_type:complete